MSTELIQTKDFLLLIDEEAEIKAGIYYVTNLGNIYKETERPFKENEGFERFTNRNIYKPVIAYYPLNSEAKELDLPLLPNPFEENLTKLAIKHISEDGEYGVSNFEVQSWIRGYQAAQSLNKQFSLEDIKKAMEYGMYKMKYHTIEAHEEFIQSLSTQQLPVSFEPDYINTNSFGSETNGYDSGNFILKTITNSEGKEELVGTYKY